jgi:hypothetical protein
MDTATNIDFDFQRQFRDHYAEIALGVVRVAVASWDDDARRNTDFQICTLDNGHRIACRARRAQYRHRYTSDFTIRYSRPSGVPTEWHKLRQGLGDFIIYGFDAGDGRLQPWHLLNAHLVREYLTGGGHWRYQANDDGTTFAAIDIDKLPIGAVLNSDGLPRGLYLGPPVGPCELCGQLVYNSGPDDGGRWQHPCCAAVAPHRCLYCLSPKSRYGWDGLMRPAA